MSSRKRNGQAAKAEARAAAVPPAPPAAEERQPDYTWAGKPVHKCKAKAGCPFSRVDNLPAVLAHELLHEESRAQTARDSLLVGTDGKPLKVAGGE